NGIGRDPEPDDLGIGGLRLGRTLLEPADQELVPIRSRLETLTAAMGHGQGRLEEEEAFLPREPGHAPPLGTLYDPGVVEFGLEAEEGTLEPSLAVLGAVTRPLVATEFRQEGLDLIPEVDRLIAIRFGQGHLLLRCEFTCDGGISTKCQDSPDDTRDKTT